MSRTGVRVTAIIKRGDEILMIHRFKKGAEYWTVVGGGVEDEETLEQALRREVMEETSLTITSFTLLDHSDPKLPFFLCETAGTPVLAGPEKDKQSQDNQYILTWFKIADLPHIAHITHPESFKNVIPKL